MTTRSHAHTLRVLVRIRDWIAHRDVTSPLADLATHREQLDTTIARLSGLGDEARIRARDARTGTLTAQQRARRLSAAYLAPVVRAARTMTDPGAEGLRDLRLPRKVRFEQLISTANTWADLVEQHRDRFLAAGLAPDASDRLREAAAGLLTAVSERSAHVGRRIAAVHGARAEAAAGRRLLQLLNTLVAPNLETNPALHAEWRALVRLSDRARGRSPAPVAGEPAGPMLVPEGPGQAGDGGAALAA